MNWQKLAYKYITTTTIIHIATCSRFVNTYNFSLKFESKMKFLSVLVIFAFIVDINCSTPRPTASEVPAEVATDAPSEVPTDTPPKSPVKTPVEAPAEDSANTPDGESSPSDPRIGKHNVNLFSWLFEDAPILFKYFTKNGYKLAIEAPDPCEIHCCYFDQILQLSDKKLFLLPRIVHHIIFYKTYFCMDANFILF